MALDKGLGMRGGRGRAGEVKSRPGREHPGACVSGYTQHFAPHGPAGAEDGGEEAGSPCVYCRQKGLVFWFWGFLLCCVFLACLFFKGKKVCNYFIQISRYISVNNKRFYNSKKMMYILVC